MRHFHGYFVCFIYIISLFVVEEIWLKRIMRDKMLDEHFLSTKFLTVFIVAERLFYLKSD